MVLILAMFSIVEVSGQDRVSRQKVSSEVLPFPLEAYQDDVFDLAFSVKDAGSVPAWNALFQKYDLQMEVSVWEELIRVLITSDRALEMVLITEDSDGHELLISTGNPFYRSNFIKLIRPILEDTAAMEELIKRMKE